MFTRRHLQNSGVIEATQSERLIGHISRDSTAIEARERFPRTASQASTPTQTRKKRKRPKRAKANERGTQIERQRHMPLDEMLAELPKQCAIGVKTSSKGHKEYWRGYKLHLDVADGQIPISAVLTGANVHDATATIPLMTMSAQSVTWLYDVMDSAYDTNAILDQCMTMNHVPIVQPHPRRNGKSKSILIFQPKLAPEMTWAQQDRFKERSTIERVNARLKDEFGPRHIRVRGAAKVFAHLAFGLIALIVDQLIILTG
ncbi:MAG: transposase [Bryobacteraceae bacterium]